MWRYIEATQSATRGITKEVEREGKARLKFVGQCKVNYSFKVSRNLWHMSKEEKVLRIQNNLEAKDDLICSPQTMNFAS